MEEQAQASPTPAETADHTRAHQLPQLPVWALPVVGLGICTAISRFYGAVGAAIAVAVLATVTIATVGADIQPSRCGRHIAQAVALMVAAVIVVLAYLRVEVTQTHPDARSAEAPLDLRNRQLSVSDVRSKILRGAQLQGATLSGLDLSGADLSGANLSGANLSGTSLSGANLSGAYLTAADLAGAHLNGTNLRGADLREACLRGSILGGADLTDVNASGADVSGAAVSQSVIAAAHIWPAASTSIGAACK